MKFQMDKAPMGWNSYDYYDTTVNEEQVKANADYMAAHLKDAGWEYIVVDIEWYAKDSGTMRDKYQYIPFGDEAIDEYGRLLPAENKFPSAAGGKGFAPLAEYIHHFGLMRSQTRLLSAAGILTCTACAKMWQARRNIMIRSSTCMRSGALTISSVMISAIQISIHTIHTRQRMRLKCCIAR